MNGNHASDDGSTEGRFALPRRIVIRAAAATGLAGLLGGRAIAQDDGNESEGDGDDGGDDVAETFELEGETGGWVGAAPEDIAGEQNPTLVMEPGEDYEVSWENADGASHNFAIEDEDSDVFVETEYLSAIGESTSVTFTAEEGFDHYVCHPHRKTMRGRIVPDESELEEEEEETEDEEEADDEGPDEVPTEVFYMDLDEDGWIGESPDGIAGETNPTLSLEAGETYAIVWTLRTERERHETGHNVVVHDEDGNHLAYTDFLSDEGTSLTLTFTAEEGMSYYSDQTQLEARGDIEVSGGSEDGDDGDDGDGDGENGGDDEADGGDGDGGEDE